MEAKVIYVLLALIILGVLLLIFLGMSKLVRERGVQAIEQLFDIGKWIKKALGLGEEGEGSEGMNIQP